MGLSRSFAEREWAGMYTITFKDGDYRMAWQGLQGQIGKCQANYEVVGDIVRLTYYQTTGNECEGGIEDIQWRLDDKGLHLHLVTTNGSRRSGGRRLPINNLSNVEKNKASRIF